MEFVTARISVMIFGLLCQNSVYFATVLEEKIDSLAEKMDSFADVVRVELRDLRVDKLGRINIIQRRLFIKTFGGSKDICLGGNLSCFTVSHVYFQSLTDASATLIIGVD